MDERGGPGRERYGGIQPRERERWGKVESGKETSRKREMEGVTERKIER